MDSSSSRTKCITERLKTSRQRDAAGDTRGFLLSAGIFTKIDVPGALDLAFPTGISANGEIVAQSYVGGFSNFNPVLGAWPRQKGDWRALYGLHSGEKIELIETGMKKHVGTFLTVTEEAIQMHEGPNAVGIPKENVARVTVLDKSHRLRNSVIFGAVGAGAGAGIAAAASRCSSSNNTFNFCALGRSVGIGIRLAIELPRLVAPLPNGLNGCRGEERVTFHNTDNCDRPSAGTT